MSHGSSSDLSRPAAESELNLEEILREKKFSHRARLFIASIHDMSHNEFRDLFRPYGEMKDAHVVKEKGIGFITLVSLLWKLWTCMYVYMYIVCVCERESVCLQLRMYVRIRYRSLKSSHFVIVIQIYYDIFTTTIR